ncbi:hypothetical protein GRF29_8g2546179 [Pseudopithomyces chartarum]|uniref:Uncharacterized protein n=1 Tax=Pseudopithomyces chartarum TaxID=1892770 RepID=A0AAN6M5K6_9PLEO|nr:hypothetical protein GRF29_8g2546179 [Pseudopithomyces chartarum]
MALERLQARAAARIPDLDRPVVRCRGEPRRVVGEGHRVDGTAMAPERLQARAAARIPDLDRPVVRCRGEPRRVVGEGHRQDPTAMALERLQARAPAISHCWPDRDAFWLFIADAYV